MTAFCNCASKLPNAVALGDARRVFAWLNARAGWPSRRTKFPLRICASRDAEIPTSAANASCDPPAALMARRIVEITAFFWVSFRIDKTLHFYIKLYNALRARPCKLGQSGGDMGTEAQKEICFCWANECPYGAFSNLYHQEIEFEDRVYPTAGHAYQAGKARRPRSVTG